MAVDSGNPPRTWRGRLLAAALSLLLLEGLSFALVQWKVEGEDLEKVDFGALRDSITEDEIRAFRDRIYDRELGWVHRPGSERTKEVYGRTLVYHIDETGARRNPYGGAPRLISVYGDSFTFGADVTDDETWPHHLSVLTGSDVRNFGMSAYGTDQALLRLERNLPRHRTEIVVLAVQGENVARLLSMYRPFYVPDSSVRVGFKPMFRSGREGFELLPNPLTDCDSGADYLAAFEVATRHDWWYRANEKRPEVGFPYFLSLVRAVGARLSIPADPWRIDEAVARMDHVLRRFAALSREHDFRPVVLFIPHPTDLRSKVRDGTYTYEAYVSRVRSDASFEGVTVLDVLEHEVDADSFYLEPFSGHTSASGNRVIADVVFGGIRELTDFPVGSDLALE